MRNTAVVFALPLVVAAAGLALIPFAATHTNSSIEFLLVDLWLVQLVAALPGAYVLFSRGKVAEPARPDDADMPDLPRWDDRLERHLPQTGVHVPLDWRAIVHYLESPADAVRRQAVQMLVDSGASPIAGIRCWPEKCCTDLQLKTAEVLLLEWAEELRAYPKATENDLIHLMFVPEVEGRHEPHFRRVAQPFKEMVPSPGSKSTPEMSDLFNAAMDKLNGVVKDTILDWKPGLPEPDGEPEEEVALRPLDRDDFAVGLCTKFDEVLELIAETVATPRTNFDLAKTEAEVGRFLHELRWDALNLALELRAPAGVELDLIPAPTSRHASPRNTAPSATGWAKKYRRMRALGY